MIGAMVLSVGWGIGETAWVDFLNTGEYVRSGCGGAERGVLPCDGAPQGY